MPTDDEEALESKRTAIALVRLDLEGRQAEWLALARGTEDKLGVIISLSSLASVLSEIVGKMTGNDPVEAIDQYARKLLGEG